MSVLSSLRLPPFNLSDSDVIWVEQTRNGLSVEDKLRQLFVQISFGDDLAAVDAITAFKPGGLCRFVGADMAAAHAATRRALENCEIPPFITGDLEGGGNLAGCMTPFSNNLGMAAVNDPAMTAKAVGIMAREAKAMGYNWTFTPCIDINKEWTSAIVGTRSYGSNPAVVEAQGMACMQAFQAAGIAATAKHWPGEGFDARDQHLVTTINRLGPDEWFSVFGRIYKRMIDAGLMSVMSAHIALPAFAAKHGIAEGLERYRPASVSKLINMDLLRGELGFNGLIVSDATVMAGFSDWAARSETAPQCIENGCDVFLFSTNLELDLSYMLQGLRNGLLSEQRVEDAVTRVLGMKAALGLHQLSIDERILPLDEARQRIGLADHLDYAADMTARSITLVKNTKNLLPLNPGKHKRICLVSRGIPGFLPDMAWQELESFRQALEGKGFVVSPYDGTNPPTPENCDLVIYAPAVESSLGRSRIYMDWAMEQPGVMNTMQRYWHDLPTIMVSFGHPYYLYDAPRVATYINAYCPTAAAQRAVVDRLLGHAPFTGVSPVDAFAGAPEARY